jgi:hypothetical protein
MFHGPEATAEMESVEKLTERVRAPLATAIKKAFVPITHTVRVTAE